MQSNSACAKGPGQEWSEPFRQERSAKKKYWREREGKKGRETESQLSRNLRAYLTAGTRWLGAEEGAAAVALAAGDGTLAEVAETLGCL